MSEINMELGRSSVGSSRGTITVVSPDTFAELLQTDDNESQKQGCPVDIRTQRSKSQQSSRSAAMLPSGQFKQPSIERRHTSSDLYQNLGDWLSEKQVQNLQEKTDFGSTIVKNICSNLLENEKEITEETEKYLEENTVLNHRKKYLLLKKWNENVYFPLKSQVNQEMQGTRYQIFDKEKRHLYRDYLKYLNTKGDVFLDVISRNEYDPLRLVLRRPGPLCAVTGKLEDPLLHQQTKQQEEDRVLIACDRGIPPCDAELEQERLPSLPLVPLGRQGTECHTWLSMELRDIESANRKKSQKRILGIRNDSSIPLDAWRRQPSGTMINEHRWFSRRRRPFDEKHATSIVLA